MKIKIWDALNEEESEAQEIELSEWAEFSINSNYLTQAVQEFVEKRWASSDYPDETWVNVTSESGKLLEFTVTAEQAVVFRAGPRDKR